MLPIIQIGPIALQLPGLILLAGLWISLSLVDREARRNDLDIPTLNNLILVGLVASILGSRLWYAARYASVYFSEPLSLFSLNTSTLAPVEGIATGLVAALIYGQRKKLPLWPTLDALAPSISLFAISVGLAHLASGAAFGAPTDLPWGIELWGAIRHPTQIYETIAAAVVFIVVMHQRTRTPFPGYLFLLWTVLFAASRLFIEAFRGDSTIVFGSLRTAQLLSLAIVAAGMLGLHLMAREKASSDGGSKADEETPAPSEVEA